MNAIDKLKLAQANATHALATEITFNTINSMVRNHTNLEEYVSAVYAAFPELTRIADIETNGIVAGIVSASFYIAKGKE